VDTAADWNRVDAALDELLALPPGARVDTLSRIAADDPALCAELQSLLAYVGGHDDLLDGPATDAIGVSDSGSLDAGQMVGSYRVVVLIGRGGMGEVYRAERADGQYQQQVALKLIRRDLADQPSRLQAERQTLARLDHPGIARLLDGGVAADGRPYMVMELVAGQTITAWCREHASSLEVRLKLFIAVCAAVEYAHRNLVVHRDLKPSNVLVANDGTVKLLDFGIAKLLGAGFDATQTRNAPMTPGYAAPEQLRHGTVTTATDVYALGMLLFELLTGERPWPLHEMSLVAGLEKVLHDTPQTLSRFAQHLSRPALPPRLLRGDLDAIVAKAIRKEPERRYDTAFALRADIERTLRHDPVTAREGARLYAAGRLLRRYRLFVASGCVIILAILIGTLAALWQARLAGQQAQRAEVATRKATAVKDFLLDIFKQSSLQNPGGAAARDVTAGQLLDIGARRIRLQLHEQPDIRGELLDTLASLYDDLGAFDQALALAQEHVEDLRLRTGGQTGIEWPQAHIQLARALIDGGRDADAMQRLNTAQTALDALGDHGSMLRAELEFQRARAAYDGSPDDKAAGLQHLQSALDIVQRRDPQNPLRGDVLAYFGYYAQLAEDYQGSEVWYKQRLVFEQSQGAERNAFAIGSAFFDLGDTQALAGEYADSETNLRQAVAVLGTAAGADHPSTANAKARLGEMYFRSGRMAQAEPLLMAALQSQQKSAQGLVDATETRKTLGGLELSRGLLAPAEAVLRENLRQLGSNKDQELRYGVSASVLTTVLAAEGKFAEAERQYAVSSDVFRRYIGEPSLAYAGSLLRGAALELGEGHLDRAAQIYEQLRSAWPPRPGQYSETYARATIGLARTDLQRGKLEAARAHSEELLRIIAASPERRYVPDHEAHASRLLGEALTRLGRGGEAEAPLRRAVELREQLDAPDSIWLAEARISLALALIAERRFTETRSLLDLARAAQGRQPALSPQYRAPLEVAARRLASQSGAVPR
jgi:hypothetical protein